MAMNSRNWSAVEQATDFSGSEHFVKVQGEVELPSTSHSAQLRKAVPGGINDTILLLDLVVTQSGTGADVMTWRDVLHDERPVSPGEYRQVTIRHDGKNLATVDVEVIHSITGDTAA